MNGAAVAVIEKTLGQGAATSSLLRPVPPPILLPVSHTSSLSDPNLKPPLSLLWPCPVERISWLCKSHGDVNDADVLNKASIPRGKMVGVRTCVQL